MERMGTEYQIFNGKEYVSLRRFWNMEGKYKTEKAKNEELEEENKELKEHKENLIRADKKKSDHIDELEKEINELKRCRSIEIETCNRYREKCDGLEKENKKLKAELELKNLALKQAQEGSILI